MAVCMHADGNENIHSLARRVVQILMVEDCKSDVCLMELMLEQAGLNCFYEITDVPRLVDAFSSIERNTFDLVMLDLNLLDIDGIASVVALHSQAPLLPIVVYSGMDDAKLKQKALLCGAAHYLVKGRESGNGLKTIIESTISPAMRCGEGYSPQAAPARSVI